ncbi:hypothetical protein CC79DRAFT_1361506 [Sarocladium strictum]
MVTALHLYQDLPVLSTFSSVHVEPMQHLSWTAWSQVLVVLVHQGYGLGYDSSSKSFAGGIMNPVLTFRWTLAHLQRVKELPPVEVGSGLGGAPLELWSRAYLAAVQSMGDDVEVAILKGDSIAQLFKELEEEHKDATVDSLFFRGVHYLRSIQVPLERFKLAIDLAAPLTAIEPTTSAVFSVIRGVTAVGISISAADVDFARQIGEMLEHIQYIDDCDTLGQKEDRADIHKALVSVYQKLLDFYVSAHGVLMKEGARLLFAVVSDNSTLPSIVADFLKQAAHLQKVVEKATLDIVTDIKAMLYDEKTCIFLLQSPEFQAWIRASTSQQLIILGDVGSGKSVAMSFLIDELYQRKQHQLPQPVVLYHYCQSDETGDILQILSSLILSFLSQLEGLKKPFFEWYQQALRLGNVQPATNVHKLSELFQRLASEVDRPLCLLIDGLDECTPTARGALLELLKNLSQKTHGLKVVLASRPWEEILDQLEGMPKVFLGQNAERDRIITEKTIETKLPRLTSDIRQLVTDRLSALAQGCAIWTKMTVELIAARKILSYGPLQLQAVARRRLSILEIAWAVALHTGGPDVRTVAEVSALVDHQCIIGLIQPFIAAIDHHDLKKRQVSLVHQSVKDFVLSHWSTLDPNRSTTTTAGQSSGAAPLDPSRLEERIMGLCVRYLLLDEINQVHLLSDEQIVIEELQQDPSIFDDDNGGAQHTLDSSWENWEEGMIRYDPADRGFGEFFVYASCYWISHYGSVDADPLPELDNVQSLCQPNSLRLLNWTSQNSRPDCVLKARFEFDGKVYDTLSITSLYGSEPLLAKMVETSNISSEDFLPNTSMLAAEQILQWEM